MIGDIGGHHFVGRRDGSAPCFEVVQVGAVGPPCRRGDAPLNISFNGADREAGAASCIGWIGRGRGRRAPDDCLMDRQRKGFSWGEMGIVASGTIRRAWLRPPAIGRPNLVQDRQIGSGQFQDFCVVGRVGIRALDVALAAKFVPQRPAQSIGDQPAFDAKNYVAEEGDPTRWPDVGPHPSG